MLLPSRYVINTKHVTFDETHFPLAQKRTTTVVLDDEASNSIDKAPRQELNNHIPHQNGIGSGAEGTISRRSQYDTDERDKDADKEASEKEPVYNSPEDEVQKSIVPKENNTEARRYPTRERKQPSRFTISELARAREDDEPSMRNALKGNDQKKWRESMDKEVKTLKQMQCWDEVERPPEARVLHTKFVLKRKRYETGNIQNYKARLVVCGNGEIDNADENFSPVPDFTVIRSILSLAAQKGWHRRHFDFQSAFSNEKLERLVYADLPKNIYDAHDRRTKVMRLKRSFCGLKDATRIWHELLTEQFAESSLTQLESAPCVFQNATTILICYVDDLLMFSENMADIERLKQRLAKKFVLKDLGQPKQFLNMDLEWTPGAVSIRQKNLIENLLNESGMSDSKPQRSPVSPENDLNIKADSISKDDADKYRSHVGSLLYLATKSRPDLCLVASTLGSHVADPTKP